MSVAAVGDRLGALGRTAPTARLFALAGVALGVVVLTGDATTVTTLAGALGVTLATASSSIGLKSARNPNPPGSDAT